MAPGAAGQLQAPVASKSSKPGESISREHTEAIVPNGLEEVSLSNTLKLSQYTGPIQAIPDSFMFCPKQSNEDSDLKYKNQEHFFSKCRWLRSRYCAYLVTCAGAEAGPLHKINRS